MRSNLARRTHAICLATAVVGVCTGADAPRWLVRVTHPDEAIIDEFIASVRGEPFSVTVRDDGLAPRRAGDVILPSRKLIVRLRNRGASAIYVDGPGGYDKRALRFEAWTAPNNEWRDLRFYQLTYRSKRTVIDPGATLEWHFLVLDDRSRSYIDAYLSKDENRATPRLRLILQYCDDPECPPTERLRLAFPVRILPSRDVTDRPPHPNSKL